MLNAQDRCTAVPLFSAKHSAATAQSLAPNHPEAQSTSGTDDCAHAGAIYRTMIEPVPNLSAGHVGLAAAEGTRDETDAAINALQQAITLAPRSLDLHLRLGVVLAHAGRLLEAQDAFCEVLDIDDSNLDAYLSLAQICRLGKHFREAIALLQEAHRLHPQNADVVAALGLVAMDIGYRDGARRLLSQLERLAPQHPERDALAQAVWAHALA